MFELDIAAGIPIDETSSIHIAKELFRSSWKHNPGKTEFDIPIFDSLSPEAQFHVLEVACAAERMLDKYIGKESDELVKYNLAIVLFTAYHSHPASSVPDLPWEGSPAEVRHLWMRYATDVITEYMQRKHMPRHKPFYTVAEVEG